MIGRIIVIWWLEESVGKKNRKNDCKMRIERIIGKEG